MIAAYALAEPVVLVTHGRVFHRVKLENGTQSQR
jgi:hypothetical protein